MKTFLGVFFGILAAVAVIVGIQAWSARSDRRAKAEELTRSTMLLAAGCRSLSHSQLTLIHDQLDRDEKLIAQLNGWDDYSVDNSIKMAALHNRLVELGCFQN